MRPGEPLLETVRDLRRCADEAALDAAPVLFTQFAQRQTLALGDLSDLAVVALYAGYLDLGQPLVEWKGR